MAVIKSKKKFRFFFNLQKRLDLIWNYKKAIKIDSTKKVERMQKIEIKVKNEKVKWKNRSEKKRGKKVRKKGEKKSEKTFYKKQSRVSIQELCDPSGKSIEQIE